MLMFLFSSFKIKYKNKLLMIRFSIFQKVEFVCVCVCGWPSELIIFNGKLTHILIGHYEVVGNE